MVQTATRERPRRKPKRSVSARSTTSAASTAIIIVGQNIQSRAADARATKTFEDVEDARQKIEHAISLLDVHTEGGLHDAVAMIIDAINAKAPAGGPAT
ncbi:MAG: hypothetical protein ACLPYY_21510 [Acidimicrobiales bacterium]